MVARCGCHDPIAWGHRDVCERELGPPPPSTAHRPTPASGAPIDDSHSPEECAEIVRHWYDRVMEWAERFDRRYSALKEAEMQVHGRIL